MNLIIQPGKLSGTLHAIPSKSHAHRMLICAAFSDQKTILHCPQTNQDIEATAECLCALGAEIIRTEAGYTVIPISSLPDKAVLNCRESGSTLRFMLPIVGALGIDTVFHMSGRLPQRPLSPLWEEMERMGCTLTRPTDDTIHCIGQLQPGEYSISGNISSQFITGLLFATALISGNSVLNVLGNLESKPYVEMTQLALSAFGVSTEGYRVTGRFPFHSPAVINIEGDWSNGAFFLAAESLGNLVSVEGLNRNSAQGDREILSILKALDSNCTISAANIPDLVPILCVVAAANAGCTITDIGRLRLKESDRVASVINMLHSLGISAEADETTMTVYPGKIQGGTVDAVNDHRIAMSAAIAATIASGPVTILGAQCVSKSYPAFWDEYARLGGQYEQYIR